MSKGFGTPGNSKPVAGAVGVAGGSNATSSRRGPSGRANYGIDLFPEVKLLNRVFKALGEQDAPYIASALDDIGWKLAENARSAAGRWGAGMIAQSVRFEGVVGSGVNMRAVVRVNHPAANSFEFGRMYYYRRATKLATTSNRGKKKWFGAYIGNNVDGYKRKKGSMKGQERYRVTWEGKPGFKMRPIMGVIAQYKSGVPEGAIQETHRYSLARLSEGIAEEWARLASEGVS